MKQTRNKTQSLRELGPIDISSLKKWVLKIGEHVWQEETNKRENDFACFHHTQHIIFRFPDNLGDRVRVHDKPIWKVWKPIILPILEKAVEPYGYKNGTIKAVMLARLKAGFSIDQHIDTAESYSFIHKIHIPIQTGEKVQFYIDPHQYNLKEGMAYEVNNSVKHSVRNREDFDRIHLIFDYMNQSLLKDVKRN